MYHLSNLLFFGIPSLYYDINLNSSITCCVSFGDIYLSFDISLLVSFEGNSSSCNSFVDFIDALVILLAISFPIKSPVASAVFLIALFGAVYCICCRLFSTVNKFLITLINYVFTNIFYQCF